MRCEGLQASFDDKIQTDKSAAERPDGAHAVPPAQMTCPRLFLFRWHAHSNRLPCSLALCTCRECGALIDVDDVDTHMLSCPNEVRTHAIVPGDSHGLEDDDNIENSDSSQNHYLVSKCTCMLAWNVTPTHCSRVHVCMGAYRQVTQNAPVSCPHLQLGCRFKVCMCVIAHTNAHARTYAHMCIPTSSHGTCTRYPPIRTSCLPQAVTQAGNLVFCSFLNPEPETLNPKP